MAFLTERLVVEVWKTDIPSQKEPAIINLFLFKGSAVTRDQSFLFLSPDKLR